MPDLGTLTTHGLHRALRRNAWTAEYIADRAACPVRLNGRACPLAAGLPDSGYWPWTDAPQPTQDADGIIYHHPHTRLLLWHVAAGSHTLTVTLRTDHTTGPAPYIDIAPDRIAATPYQRADATDDPGADQTLTLTVDAAAPAVLRCRLRSDNVHPSARTIWRTIETA